MKSRLSQLVGLSEEAARQHAMALGFTLRVVNQDGKEIPFSVDYSLDRINVRVDQWVVSRLLFVG